MRNDDHSWGFELLAAERCPRCDRPLDVISPNWLSIQVNWKTMRFLWSEEDHLEDMCLDCTLALLTEEQRRDYSETAELLLAAREELYLRSDITLVHQRTQTPVLNRKVQSTFQLDIFFLQFKGHPRPDWHVPTHVLVPDDSSEAFGMMIARQVLSLAGVVPKVVVTWDLQNFLAEKSRFEVIDWEDASPRDLQRLMEGGKYFAKPLPTGRPRGSTWFTKEECLQLYRYQLEGGGGRPSSMDKSVTGQKSRGPHSTATFDRGGSGGVSFAT